MQAIQSELVRVINGTTQFTIPVFQRDYTWAESNCEQLWNDVVRIGGSISGAEHFVGSLVYTPTEQSSAGFTQYQLIDGQQRLTTCMLMLLAIRDHIIDTTYQGGPDDPSAKRIDANFIKNEQEDGERRFKLVLRRHDQVTLRALVDREPMPDGASERIVENYEFFREMLRAEEPSIDPGVVYRGILRLIVVDVKLNASDNPQLVFESLNSTGVDLSQSDLIRNFILMSQPEKAQTALYNSRWAKIEELFRGHDSTFDAFARDYVALRTQASKQEKADNIYRAFRNSFDAMRTEAGGLEALLEHMQRHAAYYAAFSLWTRIPDDLREAMTRLSSLVDAPAILVMRLFDCHAAHKTLSTAEFREALALLESYVLRRSICDAQTRGYWQVFADMAYELDDAKPLHSLKGLLATQSASYAFPGDEEFRGRLAERDLYHMRNCWHVLAWLENHGSQERTDVGKLEIEHIMPQNENLNAEWQKMLGSAWREVQKTWLNRLGNLTLTGYNAKYSDRAFSEKQSIKDGFADSAVRLNKAVRDQAVWTEVEMRHRGLELARRAVEVWPALEVDQNTKREAATRKMNRRAQKRNLDSVAMTEHAKMIFTELRERLVELEPSLTEMPEGKSVSYYAPEFFLEVLPRKDRLTLLLPMEFSQLVTPPEIASDTAEWKFIVNAKHDAGVLVRLDELSDIDVALPLVRQALGVARSGG